jgi:diguanylate cyclase (GGDEF)-like protein/hemerythrin-like metal-binding protein
MLIDIPTMFVVIIALCLTLAMSIGWVAVHEDHDGLRPLIFALTLHGLAFTLFVLRGHIPDFWSVIVGNAAVSGGYALLALAVAAFQRRRLPPLLIWLPVAFVALAFTVFFSDIVARIATGSTVYVIQDLILLWLLLDDTRRTVGRGQHLIIVGIAINLLITADRAVLAFTGELVITHITDQGVAQTLVYLSSFISLNLVAIGFVLMSKEAADEKTRLMAMTDKLTGCWNRFRIEETAQYEMRRLQRYATPVSLILIDIDHFKGVNDSYGHVMGDLILQGVAATAQACIRNTDVLARWGGEEFVVLLPASGFSAAADSAERMRRAIADSIYGDGIQVTASFGFASYRSTDSWDEWLQRADQALYQAKAQGRNRVVAELSLPSVQQPSPAGTELLRIVWREVYALGHKTIDTQHRMLFDAANTLIDAMLSGASKDDIATKIGNFVVLSAQHMHDEEAVLTVSGFPGCAEHAARHLQLLERAELLSARYARDQLDTAELLHFVVFEFTAQHLLIEDRKFASYLAQG